MTTTSTDSPLIGTAANSERAAFDLLRAGVPLSLLLDLAMPVNSEELLRDEPADTSWVPGQVA